MIGRVLRNAASLASAQIVMKFAGLLVTILVARSLHADGFGRFASAWSYGMLVGVLADGGLAYFVALEVSRVPRTARRFVWTALALRSLICAAGLTIAALALPLLRFDGPLALAAMVFAVSAILDGLTSQALAFYRATARMHVEAKVVSFGRIFIVATTGVALLIHPSVLSFALAQATASAATVVLALLTLRADAPPALPRVRALRAIAVGALPFAASGLLSYVFFRIDTLMLRAFGIADAAIGAYSAAYRIMEAPRTVFGSVAAGILPAATSLGHPRSREELRRLAATATALVLWMVVPAVLVFALAPEAMIRLIFGHGFSGAALLLMVLSPMPILMALDAVLGSLLNALGVQKMVTGVFALCAIVNVGLNVGLIPPYGALGAAIATVGTEVVELAAFAVLVARSLGSVRPALGGLVLASAAGAGAAALAPAGLARMAAAVGVYVSVALVAEGRRRLVTA
jgi:O-antigen/teichoic acid export membrane protein